MLTVVSFFQIQAQGKIEFCASGGYFLRTINGSLAGFDIDMGDGSGFYLGLIADITVSDVFHVQSELTYANIDDVGFLQLPIMAKYFVSEKFNIQAGPQITYTLEDVIDDFTKLNIGLAIGAGYDFNEEFFVQTRFAFQLNDYFTGNGDFSSKINFLNVGIGYRF